MRGHQQAQRLILSEASAADCVALVMLAACRREQVSPWHAVSVCRHRSTCVRLRVAGARLLEDQDAARTGQHTHQRVVLPPCYSVTDCCGTLSPGAGYASASD